MKCPYLREEQMRRFFNSVMPFSISDSLGVYYHTYSTKHKHLSNEHKVALIQLAINHRKGWAPTGKADRKNKMNRPTYDECTAHFRQLFWWIRSCCCLKLQTRRFLWMHSSTWFCQYVMKLGFLMYLPSEWLTTRGRCVIYNQVQLTDVGMWSREWEGVMDCESSTGSLKLLLHYLMRGNAEPFMTGIDILPAD